MIKKVLIAEDTETTNFGLLKILNDLGIASVQEEQYCAKALIRIKEAELNQTPFDLLITDLNFGNYGGNSKINDGYTLIKAVKEVNSAIKIIVFSVEDKPSKINRLFSQLNINAFIHKGLDDKEQITKALEAIQNNQTFISSNIRQNVRGNRSLQAPSDYDLEILKRIAADFTQQQIAEEFKEKGITPNSLSTIEKRLKILRESYNVSGNTQLVVLVKELGYI